MEEIWKAVPGYEGLYAASNFGKVAILQTRMGRGPRHARGRSQEARVISGRSDTPILLIKDDLPVRRMQLCHVILLTFVGPQPEGTECCHYDDDTMNNALTNLRWDTSKANKEDVRRNGNMYRGRLRGSKHKLSKLTETMVIEARQLYATGAKIADLARMCGVTWAVMQKVLLRRTWTHV